MSAQIKYYVWRSDERTVSSVDANTAQSAATRYALDNKVPFNVALRVVPWTLVTSFGIEVNAHELEEHSGA